MASPQRHVSPHRQRPPFLPFRRPLSHPWGPRARLGGLGGVATPLMASRARRKAPVARRRKAQHGHLSRRQRPPRPTQRALEALKKRQENANTPCQRDGARPPSAHQPPPPDPTASHGMPPAGV